MTSQKEFVESCLIKYRYESIPPGEEWNDAHYPTPDCKGGVNTTPLWRSDHAAHNVIQSEEIGYPCVFGWELEYLINDYEYLIPLYYKWTKIKCSLAGKKAKELKVGIHSPGMQSLGGTTSKKLGVGIFDEGRKDEYKKAYRQNGLKVKEKGVGIFAEGQQSLGGKITQELKVGLFGLSLEDKKEAERKGGQTTGKLPRWTNGTTNRYCEEKPGPEWYPGVTRKKQPPACEA
jgi:hypothetical protein